MRKGTMGAIGLRGNEEKYYGKKSATTPFATGGGRAGGKGEGKVNLALSGCERGRCKGGWEPQRSQGRRAHSVTKRFRGFNAVQWHPSRYARHQAPSPDHRRIRTSLLHFHCLGRKCPPHGNSARYPRQLERRFFKHACR